MTATKGKRTYFPEGLMKQRSFYMDDETYDLIQGYAERVGASRGAALRHIVRHVLLDAPAEPLNTAPIPAFVPEGQREVPYTKARDEPTEVVVHSGAQVPGHEIILPPDTQETFRVPEKFREKGPRVPRPKHDDDDF